MRSKLRASILVLSFCAAASAQASPWAQTGDAQLRSDIEILANAGVLNNITTQWPLPWSGILTQLRLNLGSQPAYVREAAERVLEAGEAQTAPGVRGAISVDATNKPNVVRGFDALGREDGQAQLSAEYMGSTTAVGISAGAEYLDRAHRYKFLPDGSYAAQTIGGALLYGGYVTHWWGPGWISALSLSNNARPFPQVGIERADTSAFSDPWLSWIGPWQAELFVGLLDGPRVDRNTLYNGFRVSANPLPGLEIALARTEEVCGEHHECNPISEYFEFANDYSHRNHTNDEGNIDIRYTNRIEAVPFEIYTQLMNEDSNPIKHSITSHLYGGSIWIPLADSAPLRLTAEYTDSIPTVDIFGGGLDHGAAYNNSDYVDGMRYRDRALGFSLDSDSRLLSFQGSWIARNGFTYTLTYDRADISSNDNHAGNVVTTSPVKINMGVARFTMPFSGFRIDLEGRVQDDRPRPEHGATASIETALTFQL